MRQFWQSPPSGTGSAARAKRLRSKSRSTIVATHQPVIGSLRSSNRPALMAGSGPDRDGALEPLQPRLDGLGERAREDGAGPFDRAGRRWLRGAAELLGDRRRDEARLAARVDELEVAQVDVDVQGDAVVAHATLNAQAERSDLAERAVGTAVDPAARMTVA